MNVRKDLREETIQAGDKLYLYGDKNEIGKLMKKKRI